MEGVLPWYRMYIPPTTVSHLLNHVRRSISLTGLVGIITGVTGAAGDLGGIIFLLIARYCRDDYGKVFWIIGVITIAGNILVSWIRPIPKGQLGGR